MKLIIDIPEEEYRSILSYVQVYNSHYADMIRNGKPYEERPQGEWIKWNFKTFGAFGDYEYKCSNCEKVYGGEYNFCPNCGADMRGGAEWNW